MIVGYIEIHCQRISTEYTHTENDNILKDFETIHRLSVHSVL